MSAYVVSDWHCQYLAAWYLASEGAETALNPVRLVEDPRERLRTLAGILKADCIEGVRARYPADTPDSLPGNIGQCRDIATVKLPRQDWSDWRSVRIVWDEWKVAPVELEPMRRPVVMGRDMSWMAQLFRAIDVYVYQSDHGTWPDSASRVVLDQLRAWACTRVPGYNNAPPTPTDLRRRAVAV